VNIILLGAPGSGKGTQSKILQEKLSVPQISTGDMLRAARQAHTPLGLKAEKFMNAGRLVPDEVVIGLIEDRLKQPDASAGFILDGFPRTMAQAESLQQMLQTMGKRLDAVVNLEVEEDELLRCLSGRRTCERCGTGFHLEFSPPQNEGICDACGGRLIQREDDREATIRQRLKVYRDQTAPVVDYYTGKGLLEPIPGSGPTREVSQRLVDFLEKAR